MRLAFALLVACTNAPAPPRDTPAPKPAEVPVVHAPAKPTIVSLDGIGDNVVCARDRAGGRRCAAITLGGKDRYLATPATSRAFDFVADGRPCKLAADTLACAGAAPIANVRYRFGGAYYGYLERPDGVSWFLQRYADRQPYELHPVTGIGPVAQLAVGWRVACALDVDGATWCWSDPHIARRIATPPDVAEIFVQDPFELCLRTKSGAVRCSPAFSQPDPLACAKSSLACGTGGAEDPNLYKPFDPLAKLARPLVPIAVPRAAAIQRDDDQIYAICMEGNWLMSPREVGGCAVDGSAVTCFAACGARWRTYRVTGLPATVQVAPDTDGGFAIARDHTVWRWTRPDVEGCGPLPAVPARRLAGAALDTLSATVYVQTGPSTHDHLRCGITPDGRARCLTVGSRGPGDFDPFP